MSRRGAALLLLALLGACAVVSAEVAYSIVIDDISGPSYVGYPRDFTGSLKSDENCDPPPPPPGKVTNKVTVASTFCTPVPDTTVTIKLEGVGELSATPSRRTSAVKPKGTAPPAHTSAAKPKATAPPSSSTPASAATKKPTTKAVAELQVATDMDGKFYFRISSAEEGESIFSATTELGGANVTSDNSAVTWGSPQYTVWPDQEAASDTVGYNHALKFTLLLGQPPSRQAPLPSKSPKVPAKAPKALETPYDLPPVAGANLTFFRIDHDASNLGRAPAKQHAAPKIPSSKDIKARVKAEWTAFGSAMTDTDGVVSVDVTSPAFEGQTEVLVVYTDAQGIDWNGYSTIAWSGPIIPSVNVTDDNTSNITPGQNTTVAVTIVDAAGNPLQDVPVTFNVTGPAYLVETPQRKGARTLDVIDKVVYTDVNGQASIVLASDDPSVNTINISYDINGRIFYMDAFTLTWAAPPTADFSTIKLAPKRQDVSLGRSANLTATVETDAGVGIEGVRVRFTLTPARQFNNEEAHLEADDGMVGTTSSAEVAAQFREVVTDANGQAKLTLSGLLPGRFKVVASATNAAGTLVTSEPAFISWYSKPNKGYYGHKKQHQEGYDKPVRRYREGERRNEDYRGNREETDYDRKTTYKRPHTYY